MIVRHPVERAWSSYWHARRYGLEKLSFEEALAVTVPRASGLQAPRYVAGSLYSKNVGRYLDLFQDRVLVLVFEELFADVRRGLRRIFEFVEVDPSAAETLRTDVLNPYSRPRNPVAERIYSGQAVRFLARRAVPARFHHRVERVALARGSKPPLEPRLRRRSRSSARTTSGGSRSSSAARFPGTSRDLAPPGP